MAGEKGLGVRGGSFLEGRERDFSCYLGLVLKEVPRESARTRPCAQVPTRCSGLWAPTQDSCHQPHPSSREEVSISRDTDQLSCHHLSCHTLSEREWHHVRNDSATYTVLTELSPTFCSKGEVKEKTKYLLSLSWKSQYTRFLAVILHSET